MSEQTTLRLQSMVPLLDGLPLLADATMQYCILSDAVFWSDEIPLNNPEWNSEYSSVLRFVLRHRTIVWLKDSDNRCEEIFVAAQTLFPQWPGFRRMHIVDVNDVKGFYEHQRLRSLQEMDETIRLAKEQTTPL